MPGSHGARVVGYVRVSTKEQADDGVSLESQTEKVRSYARLYGLTLVCVLCDAGESAKTLNRPALREALELLCTGRVDGMLVAKLDRLTRSVRDLGELLDRYFGEAGGKQLYAVEDSIDTTTAAGRLLLNVLISVAQWEREIICDRTKDAIELKRSKGEQIGQLPYGWRLGGDGKTLVRDEGEMQVLSRMRILRSAGMSYHLISELLNNDQVRAKNGGRWHASTVHAVLNRAEQVQ